MLTLRQAAAYLLTKGRKVRPDTLSKHIRNGRLPAVWNESYHVWEVSQKALDEYHRTARPGAPLGNQNAKGNRGRWAKA